MTRLLLLGHDLGDSDQDLDGQQAHTVLVVLCEMLKHGYHFLDHDRCRHLLDELCKVGGSLTTNHRGLVVDKLSKLLTKL